MLGGPRFVRICSRCEADDGGSWHLATKVAGLYVQIPSTVFNEKLCMEMLECVSIMSMKNLFLLRLVADF